MGVLGFVFFVNSDCPYRVDRNLFPRLQQSRGYRIDFKLRKEEAVFVLYSQIKEPFYITLRDNPDSWGNQYK